MKKLICIGVMITFFSSCHEDKKQTAIKEIIAADIAFSVLSSEEGMHHAFLNYIDKEGVMLRPNSLPIIGKTAVAEMFDAGDDSGYSLTWEPISADASVAGDMGYSYGKYTLQLPDTTKYGTYVSVWRKSDGKWKFVLDAGNSGLGEKKI